MMNRISFFVLAAVLLGTVASAQPGGRMPDAENVVLTQRAATQQAYGGPINPEGRSYNFTPTFYIYPDTKLDKAGAEALLAEMGIQPILDANYGVAIVLNPLGSKYDADKDFEAFVAQFNRNRSGNLKVIGIGAGATFVNQVIAPKAGDHIAGILTVGGQPAKLAKNVDSYGVPAYVSGKKAAAKVAKAYIALNKAVLSGDHYVNPNEELLTVYSDPVDRSLSTVFADAWKKVLGRNYRYNNYKHTHYEGQQFGQFGPYELEPYLDLEALGITRNIVEQASGRQADAPKQLWYEYWPQGLQESAPAQSVPVMVLLHGNTNDPRTQAETSGFIQLAAKERFFVVEMEWQGSASYQAMGHDGIESVLYQLFAKYPQLDPSRVYAEGLSAGSMTASALGIKKSHVFAAVGGHSGGIMGGNGGAFPGFTPLWGEATQKHGAVEMPYCSVLGTADNVVPFVKPDNWKGNGYLNAWNAYQQMNGMELIRDLDFSVDPLFGMRLRDRETITTNKGAGIQIETGQLYKGNVPLIKIVAVKDYGHWNFQPTAQIMWDYFKQFRRDPETKKLIYLGNNANRGTVDADFIDDVAMAMSNGGKVDLETMKWTREPAAYAVRNGRLTVTTEPHTDLWQRTYYHFRNDNAPVFQMQTREQYFSFVVKTDFTQSHHRFDQCGIVMYLDSDNWLKGSVEFENDQFQHLGSVVTNNGYSDWATTAIPADVKTMWYRFSRRADDYCIECSNDGVNFTQMRVCHMYAGSDVISFGIYACSPEESSFTAVFTDMKVTECMWKAHDGQQPDKE